jgi:hypothetical protein
MWSERLPQGSHVRRLMCSKNCYYSPNIHLTNRMDLFHQNHPVLTNKGRFMNGSPVSLNYKYSRTSSHSRDPLATGVLRGCLRIRSVSLTRSNGCIICRKALYESNFMLAKISSYRLSFCWRGFRATKKKKANLRPVHRYQTR